MLIERHRPWRTLRYHGQFVIASPIARVLFAAALLGTTVQRAAAAPQIPSVDLADRFRTAPETLPALTITAGIFVNGVAQGDAEITVENDRITIPHKALQRLRLASLASDALELTPDGPIAYDWEPAISRLRITVPVASLQPLRLGVAADTLDPALILSPEAAGIWVDYDANLRHSFEWGQHFGARLPASVEGGLFTDFHISAYNFLFDTAWSYDSERIGQPMVRLDSSFTWRPPNLEFSAKLGDVTDRSTGEARPFRFLGIEIGTDHSAQPGFIPIPVPQIAGSAAAGSTIDTYIDSQRVASTQTSGGGFNLLLPPNGGITGARIVVTDVTGQQKVLSVQAPIVNAQTIRSGLLLWSAGIGVPRFDFGSVSDNYTGGVFGQVNLHYGLTNLLTLTAHGEAGSGLGEIEAGLNLQATPWLALRGNLGSSLSRLGTGATASASLVAAMPYGWFLNASVTQDNHAMADVVAISGLAYAQRQHQSSALVLPPRSMAELAASWQISQDLSTSLTATRYVYASTGPAGFVSASVQGNMWGQHVYGSVTRSLSHHADLTVLVGVTFLLGQTILSGGAGWEQAEPDGSFSISHTMQDGVGSLGWQAEASHADGQTAGTASLTTRTGYGMPGVQVIATPGNVTAYATATGSAGLAAGHPFASDPVEGGMAVVDAGAPNVPITNNGFPEGRSAADGKLVVPLPVAGTPQNIAVSASELPLGMVAAETAKTVLVRNGGIAVVHFGVEDAGAGATIIVTVHGHAPRAGSILSGIQASAPVDSRGRAYLPRLAKDEVLVLTRLDGMTCKVATNFDGQGGPGRRIGPIPCQEGDK